MKKSSRKRLLVSSVAMLLVAMLALGTATYAWFTTNTTANADGIYVHTTKASTLKISKNDFAWKNSITYTQGTSENSKMMIPASSGDGASWFTATAVEGVDEAPSTGALKAGTVTPVTANASNAQYVFKNMLNVKNDGGEGASAINNVTISITLPENASDYARVALVPCNQDGTELTTARYENQKLRFKNCVYDQSGEEYRAVKSVSGTGDAQTVEYEPITGNTGTVSVGTLVAEEAAYYNLYVWFEGQDKDCKDVNAGQTLAGLEFSVTGDPA